MFRVPTIPSPPFPCWVMDVSHYLGLQSSGPGASQVGGGPMSPCGEPENPCCLILAHPGSTTAQFLVLLDFRYTCLSSAVRDMFTDVVCSLGFPHEHGVRN